MSVEVSVRKAKVVKWHQLRQCNSSRLTVVLMLVIVFFTAGISPKKVSLKNVFDKVVQVVKSQPLNIHLLNVPGNSKHI